MNPESYIEAYPVGLFADIRHHKIKCGLKYLRWQVGHRDWRAVRNYFNGYLAEWHYPPSEIVLHRCGRGWTRRSAIRNLGHHIAEANSPYRQKD